MDWIDAHVAYTAGSPSPEIFRLWSAITAVSGALERRVYIRTSRAELFPNLLTLLVAPPAVGKSMAISPIHHWWMGTKKLKVAPDNVTKASLIDSIEAADRQVLVKSSGKLIEQHPLLICQSELGVLLSAYDLDFLSVINHLYDSPPSYREERRTMNRKTDIVNPQITALLGTQPGFLASTLPETAWSMGFCSRLIMVYAATSPVVDLFPKDFERDDKARKDQLQAQFNLMVNFTGPAKFTDKALAAFREWHLNGMGPVPEHSKLEHYRGRRALHILKLCMCSAASRTSGEEHVPDAGLMIELSDLHRAFEWLFHAEALMPDVFRDMTGRSDSQVIQELHYFMWKSYSTGPSKGRPITEALMMAFLSRHVPTEKIAKIIEIAERANFIKREAGTGGQGTPGRYIPTPKNTHGVE